MFTAPLRKWGLVFAVDCDTLYGRSGQFRDALDQEGFKYYADVPINTQVYLDPPQIVYPLMERGIPSKNHEVIGIPYTVEEVQTHEKIAWEKITLRPNEKAIAYEICRFSIVRHLGLYAL